MNTEMASPDDGLESRLLFDAHEARVGRLPPALCQLARDDFEALWALHPEAFHTIRMRGREVPLPRWQQAYERDYRYTGAVNQARRLPLRLRPYLTWCQMNVGPLLNGVLLNWYDAELGHYIGPHRDSRSGLLRGSPIVTISLGASRTLRFRRPARAGGGKLDLVVAHGDVVVVPWATNLALTHEVPRFKRDSGRRISITARAFA